MPTDYENLFETVPVDANKYREPSTVYNDLFGRVLLPDLDHPASLPMLVAHADNEVLYHWSISVSLLSSAQTCCISTGTCSMHSLRCWTFESGQSQILVCINNAGAFINGVFVVQRDVLLARVTIESFLVSQCVQFSSRHHLRVSDIWDVMLEDVPISPC
jgi:hypothetical protein